jgi:anaerobic selenocysteine-containing dehydrogenase
LITYQLIINPKDADKKGFSDSSQVELKLGDKKYITEIHLDPSVPKGVILIPRSMGIPLDGPERVVLGTAK